MNIFATLFCVCPKCESGKMYTRLVKMNETCSKCDFKFDREEGYYTGAIAVGNFLLAAFVAPVTLWMFAQKMDPFDVIAFLVLFSVFLMPLVFRYSRSIWLHFDYSLHRDD